MLALRPIRPDEVPAARRLIYTVAREIFQDPRPLEDCIASFDAAGTLQDMDDVQTSYLEKGGAFLVLLDGERLIGTGALRELEEGVAEIKRLWLLPEYHHRGLGRRMLGELLAEARRRGYQAVRLKTDRLYQQRALEVYLRAGFREIPTYGHEDPDDIALQLDLMD